MAISLSVAYQKIKSKFIKISINTLIQTIKKLEAIMSSIINPRNNWLTALGSLLGGTLEKQYKPFHDSLDCVARYVINKSGPRLISKQFRDAASREKMIERLFRQYQQGITLTELCKSTFMRKMVKRDRINEPNLDFIYKFITPTLIKHFPAAERLQKDPAVRLWMREFSATTMEPQPITEQKDILNLVPKKDISRFIKGRNEINDSLIEATLKGWIGRQQLEIIISALADKKRASNKGEVEKFVYTEETAVRYFITEYGNVIDSGGAYLEQFRASIIKNLMGIQNNLGKLKSPANNVNG